ncbi:MAG: hypothetical protein AAGJ35_14440, partial [Myxococcota bacterium]
MLQTLHSSGAELRIYGMVVDANQDIFVAGFLKGTFSFPRKGIEVSSRSTGAPHDLFVAKMNSAGNLRWIQVLPLQESSVLN